jgi:fructose-bisphosphate aldolase class II
MERNKILETVREVSLKDGIVPGFNVFGYEDSLAIVRAAEKAGNPVLLMTNKDALGVADIEIWGALLSSVAKRAKVRVGVHLDHCTDKNTICRAMDCGYDSVMYDGSQLPFEENAKNTKEIVDIAHRKNIAVEGEIGSVPYDDKPGQYKTLLTDASQAEEFERRTGVDWMAISVGNIHRLTDRKSSIRFDLLREIRDRTSIPLVIHGATGISDDELRKLRHFRVGKLNIGTVMRKIFGETLRETVIDNPNMIDRLDLLKNSAIALEKKTAEILEMLYA